MIEGNRSRRKHIANNKDGGHGSDTIIFLWDRYASSRLYFGAAISPSTTTSNKKYKDSPAEEEKKEPLCLYHQDIPASKRTTTKDRCWRIPVFSL